MGNAPTGGEAETYEGSGYRVFNLYHGSPAYEAGLEVYFDYIVAINDQPVDGRQTSRNIVYEQPVDGGQYIVNPK